MRELLNKFLFALRLFPVLPTNICTKPTHFSNCVGLLYPIKVLLSVWFEVDDRFSSCSRHKWRSSLTLYLPPACRSLVLLRFILMSSSIRLKAVCLGHVSHLGGERLVVEVPGSTLHTLQYCLRGRLLWSLAFSWGFLNLVLAWCSGNRSWVDIGCFWPTTVRLLLLLINNGVGIFSKLCH